MTELTAEITRHPARFSQSILDILSFRLRVLIPDTRARILDPFAGVGLVHTLGYDSVGVELEPEWGNQHARTITADATALPFPDHTFAAIVTSPCYGNRLADSHNAKDGSRRITYTHYLGRPLHPNNAGSLQWGDSYRQLHHRAWDEAYRVLQPGGFVFLNVSDHVRKGQIIPVTWWHHAQWVSRRCVTWAKIPIPTARMRFGQNHALRVDNEWLLILRKL